MYVIKYEKKEWHTATKRLTLFYVNIIYHSIRKIYWAVAKVQKIKKNSFANIYFVNLNKKYYSTKFCMKCGCRIKFLSVKFVNKKVANFVSLAS
jgi:hypothetical protein